MKIKLWLRQLGFCSVFLTDSLVPCLPSSLVKRPGSLLHVLLVSLERKRKKTFIGVFNHNQTSLLFLAPLFRNCESCSGGNHDVTKGLSQSKDLQAGSLFENI